MISFYITNSSRKVSPIVMYLSFRGKRYNIYIGERVMVDLWVKKRQRSKVFHGDIEAELLNAELEKWEVAGKKALAYFKDKSYIPNQEEMSLVIERFRKGESDMTQHISVVEYFDTFISRYSKTRSASRVTHYRLAQNLIRKYQSDRGRTLYFEDMNVGFVNDFTSWFYRRGKEYSPNYIGDVEKILRMVYNEAREVDGIHSKNEMNAKGIKIPNCEVDNIYLTEDEIEAIRKVKIDESSIRLLYGDKIVRKMETKIAKLKKARDLFVIGAYTGLRFSDVAKLKPYNFADNKIKIVADKTGIKSVIPVHPSVKKVLDDGYDFETKIGSTYINNFLRDICRLAGIVDKVMVIKNRGGRYQEVVTEKYKLVSSHTARRSFATNAYKAGIPNIAIMKMTGHRTESSFLKYIKVSESENADMLMGHSFFNDKENES